MLSVCAWHCVFVWQRECEQANRRSFQDLQGLERICRQEAAAQRDEEDKLRDCETAAALGGVGTEWAKEAIMWLSRGKSIFLSRYLEFGVICFSGSLYSHFIHLAMLKTLLPSTCPPRHSQRQSYVITPFVGEGSGGTTAESWSWNFSNTETLSIYSMRFLMAIAQVQARAIVKSLQQGSTKDHFCAVPFLSTGKTRSAPRTRNHATLSAYQWREIMGFAGKAVANDMIEIVCAWIGPRQSCNLPCPPCVLVTGHFLVQAKRREYKTNSLPPPYCSSNHITTLSNNNNSNNNNSDFTYFFTNQETWAEIEGLVNMATAETVQMGPPHVPK